MPRSCHTQAAILVIYLVSDQRSDLAMGVLILGALLISLYVGVMALPVVEVGFNEATIAKVEADLLQIAVHRYVAYIQGSSHNSSGNLSLRRLIPII